MNNAFMQLDIIALHTKAKAKFVVIMAGIFISIIQIHSNLSVINLEWWRDYWTVSDIIEQSGVTERYLANAIISGKSKWR